MELQQIMRPVFVVPMLNNSDTSSFHDPIYRFSSFLTDGYDWTQINTRSICPCTLSARNPEPSLAIKKTG